MTPKSSQPWVATLVRTVFDQADANEVGGQFDRVVEALSEKLPKAADHLSGADYATDDAEVVSLLSSVQLAGHGPVT